MDSQPARRPGLLRCARSALLASAVVVGLMAMHGLSATAMAARMPTVAMSGLMPTGSGPSAAALAGYALQSARSGPMTPMGCETCTAMLPGADPAAPASVADGAIVLTRARATTFGPGPHTAAQSRAPPGTSAIQLCISRT